MKIENNNPILFKAKFINKINVGKYTGKIEQKYTNQPVSFVKINPSNEQDINALKDASMYWENAKIITNIYYAACALRNRSKYYINHDVYALTSQKSDFENLDSDKILGLVHVSPYIENTTLIEQLQVKPELIFSRNPEYKGIGTGILNSLKLLIDKISCFSSSEKSVKDFYVKNGFIKQQGLSNY